MPDHEPIIDRGRVIGGLDPALDRLDPSKEAVCCGCGHSGEDHLWGLMCDATDCKCEAFRRPA